MLKSNRAATHKVSWSIFTDLNGYIFNIVGGESKVNFKNMFLGSDKMAAIEYNEHQPYR